jgi:nicotinamide riboside transporter PnuC
VTGDNSPRDSQPDSYYIPPTAGPGAKEKPLPEITKGDDWNGLAIIVFGMVILFAGFQLFLIIMQLINTWIADQLVPFFTAAFDVIVIAAGIWLIRKYSQKK